MAITVSEARTALEYMKKDISDVDSDTFLKWCNYSNREFYRIMSNCEPERYISSSTVSVVADTVNYALPADFRDMTQLGCGLFLVNDAGEDTSAPLGRKSFGETKTGFYVSGTNIVMTPVPKESKTYKLRYIPTISDLTGDSSEFVIPDEFEESLISLLNVHYTIWDEDSGEEALADARYIRILNNFTINFRKEVDSIYLPDFSTIY